MTRFSLNKIAIKKAQQLVKQSGDLSVPFSFSDSLPGHKCIGG